MVVQIAMADPVDAGTKHFQWPGSRVAPDRAPVKSAYPMLKTINPDVGKSEA